MNANREILLIDDNPTWRDTLADFLRSRGFAVQTAGQGDTGLELLVQCKPQLAVIDFQMPGLNGLELLRALRRTGTRVNVLLLSSEDDPELPARALAEGARAFLSKTLPPSELLKTLLTTLSALAAAAETANLPPDRRLPVPVPRRRNWLVPVLFYRREE